MLLARTERAGSDYLASYLAEDGAVASRDLLRHETQPGGEVTAFGERISVADRGHHSLDSRGAIVLRQKWSRGQVEARLANMSPCLIGMEACVGAHHLSRKLKALGHDARLMPAKYVRPYSK